MVTRALLILVLAMLAGPAAAQDGGAPIVPAEAPDLPALLDTGPGESLPTLPTGSVVQDVSGTADPSLPANTDLMHLILVAHPVVQAVMAALALAIFAALTVFVQKTVEYALANRRLIRALAALTDRTDLSDVATSLGTLSGPGADMARAASDELALAEADPALVPGTRDRTRVTLSRLEAAEVQSLRTGTGVLASIGAVAPFVGLFGTVFGIMNSFLAIAETKTTNLSVVAPGIAEALLATAIGLAAAIPAVLFYNLFARRLASYRRRLGDLATALEVLQSRALDRLASLPVAGG